LANDTSVRSLSLKNNRFGAAGFDSIAEMLLANQSLTDLNVGECGFGGVDSNSLCELTSSVSRVADVGGFRSFAAALALSSTLQQLNLSFNSIREGDMQQLTEAIKRNKSVVFLDLSFTGMHEAEYRMVGDMIKENTTLADLDIEQTNPEVCL
jgi:Leucine-rich repeat (LRR) protein